MLEHPRREKMFNVPPVVLVLTAVLVAVQALFSVGLTAEQQDEFLALFAFIPARYDASVTPDIVWPGGWAAGVWTFVTYALIHGDLIHLSVNGVWLLAFGSPIARRFGSLRFIVFFIVTAAAGAAAHLVTHLGDLQPMIGASAAISGCMAAAIRFVFQRGGPLHLLREADADAYRVPALPLMAALRDRRILVFLIAWFAINALFAFTSAPIIGTGQVVAWQAHIGGFAAGLLLFFRHRPSIQKAA